MRAEDIISAPAIAREVAAEVDRLPTPAPEQLTALEELLARTERPPMDLAWPPFLRGAVEKKDTRYADAPHSHRPVLGPVLVTAKRVFRGTFQPFINEVMRRQVEFNEALLSALATLHDTQQENARLQAAWRKEMEARIARMEAAASSQPEQRPTPKRRTGGRSGT